MDLLKRDFAPLLPDAWNLVDQEAKRVLSLHLAGRKIVDFRGPHGWDLAAANTGRLELVEEQPAPDVSLGIRRVQPLVEVRVPIRLPMMELDEIARGAADPELGAVVRAAEKIALAEDRAVFHGLARANITGLVAASPHRAIAMPSDLRDLARVVLEAKEVLRRAGVSGPYALVLGGALYDRVLASTDDGHPIARRIEQLLVDKPLVRAEALEGGVVLSLRGGDYELVVGQDLSLGYAHHTKEEVELYITESFTFRVLEPTAAVVLSARPSG